MNYELAGVLHKKYDTVNVSKDPAKDFNKREFVVEVTETNSQGVFTDTIKFELTQDKVTLLDAFNVGDSIKVQFGINGRAWTKQGATEPTYFNNLKAWKIEKVEGSMQAPSDTQAPNLEDDSDDLPFN